MTPSWPANLQIMYPVAMSHRNSWREVVHRRIKHSLSSRPHNRFPHQVDDAVVAGELADRLPGGHISQEQLPDENYVNYFNVSPS